MVTTESGELVAPGSQTCSAYLGVKELAPGERFVFTPVRWSMLSPGTYLLRGQVIVHHEGVAQSLPVTIRVAQ